MQIMIGFQWLKKTNFSWFKIDRSYTKTAKDVYIWGLYIPPHNSKYFIPELFEELEKDIENFACKGRATSMQERENIQAAFVTTEIT